MLIYFAEHENSNNYTFELNIEKAIAKKLYSKRHQFYQQRVRVYLFSAGSAAGISAGKFTSTKITNSGVLSPNVTSFLSSQTVAGGKPKAYLNWVLFDEQFKYVSGSSGFEQVGASNALTRITDQI